MKVIHKNANKYEEDFVFNDFYDTIFIECYELWMHGFPHDTRRIELIEFENNDTTMVQFVKEIFTPHL